MKIQNRKFRLFSRKLKGEFCKLHQVEADCTVLEVALLMVSVDHLTLNVTVAVVNSHGPSVYLVADLRTGLSTD